MKKITLLIFVALLAFNIGTANAGHWTSWEQATVAVDGTYTAYFTPGQTGNHKIEFVNQSNIYNGGYMISAWGSINDNPIVWHTWATSDVFSYYRQQNLYTGSSDIVFRFIFANTWTTPVTFYWRYYIDY